MKVRLSNIHNTGPKRETGNLADLKASIAEIGLINPLTVDSNLNMLAGRRRYQALKELWGDEYEVEVRVLAPDDPLKSFRITMDENLRRKPLTDAEVSAQIKEYDDIGRKLFGEAKGGGDRQSIGHSVTDGWSTARTAEDLGISKPAVIKSLTIARAVEEKPERTKLSGQAILADYKKSHIHAPEVPKGQYKTIVIDPPWPIEKILRETRPNQVDMDYPTMTIEEIKSFPVPEMVFPDGCHIYLWTTHKFLPVAFEILKHWGINYECLLTWVKNVGFTPYSWMYSTEHCLFGRIGNLPLLKLGKRVDFSAKVIKHSRKPNEFYDLVRAVSPKPRIDLFGREDREGFAIWGNKDDAV